MKHEHLPSSDAQSFPFINDAPGLLQLCIDRLNDAIVITEAQPTNMPGPRIVWANQVFYKKNGYTPEEIIGKSPRILQGPDTDRATLDRIRTAIENWQPIREEALNYKKDGTTYWNEFEIVPIANDKGWYTHWVSIQRDVSERKKLDQRLRDQQFYTRSLIEANIDAIMTTDPVGIITDVNRQMESLTGCTRDELVGAPFKKFFTNPERAEAAINLALNDKKVTDYELTARSRDGLETVVSYNATTFYNRERSLLGVFAAARDVTERKRLDGLLEEKNLELEAARAVAEKANSAKSNFLSSMSHELRSPMNAILGFAQLMESEVPALNDLQQGRVSQILHAGWHLLDLINEVLDLTKIESRQIQHFMEPVHLGKILDECRGMVQPQAQRCGISMRFAPVEEELFVLADNTRVKQVLINLLTNAIKYNRQQGVVEVLCSLQPQKRVRVSIRDTGLGLRQDQQVHLFQAFNRLGQETSGVEGTGIGLVVAKQLVELMGGTIGVQSAPGEGSVFWFELGQTDQA
jgi:PAS domain S-box-containing protein